MSNRRREFGRTASLDRRAGRDRRRDPVRAGPRTRISRQVATWLNAQGIRLAEVRVVPDVEERIVEAVNALRTRHDYCSPPAASARPTTTSRSMRSPRRSAWRWSSIRKRARDPGGLLSPTSRRAQRGAPADGAGARGRRADPQPSSGAPGIKIGNVYILGRRPAHRREHARRADRQARGRAAAGLGHVGALPPKAKSPTCCARPRPRIPASPSAAIRSSRTAASARISSSAPKTASSRADDGDASGRRAPGRRL